MNLKKVGPFLRFKRELQTENVTARPWSRDILRFAFPIKNPMLKVIVTKRLQAPVIRIFARLL